MPRCEDGSARRLLGALLTGPVTPDLAGRAAAALDLPERGRYAVVALVGDGSGVPPVDGGDGAGDGPPRFLWQPGTERDTALVSLGDQEPADLARRLNDRHAGRGGVGPAVAGLTELPTARRLAEVALLTCPPDGTTVVTLDRRLPAALMVSQPELTQRLVRDVLGPLLTLPAAEREVLVATWDAWLECGGSAGRAAARLYCHRNTVLNRLRRLERLTARSPAWPRELVELTMALDALRLAPPPR